MKDFAWVKIDGINYKTQLILHIPNEDGECFDMADVTEGIGSKHGFMGRGCNQLTAGFEEYFRCFQSDHVVYKDVEECEVQDCFSKGFEIGDKWTYETEQGGFGTFTSISSRDIEIIDTSRYQDIKVFHLSTGDRFYYNDRKFYYWDEGLNSYEMYYDFKNDSTYNIKYYDQFMKDTFIATVKIDSTYILNISGTDINVQGITLYNSHTHPDGAKLII